MSESRVCLSAAEKHRLAELLRDRGGLPQEAGDKCKPIAERIRALRWQAERFAEVVAWDDFVAASVIDGTEPFHKAMMTMRFETGEYDGEAGDLLYDFDVWIQSYIDPFEDVRR